MRLSYSFLSAWDRGDIDNAIALYFHNKGSYSQESERRMNDGILLHEELDRYITKFGNLPDWFSNVKLGKGRTEQKLVARYNDIFELSGMMDYLDTENGVIYDWKFGTTSALDWAGTWQMPLYFLICDLLEIPVKSGRIIRHNQYEKKTDWCVVHNTKSARELIENVIETVGNDAYLFFEREGLLT